MGAAAGFSFLSYNHRTEESVVSAFGTPPLANAQKDTPLSPLSAAGGANAPLASAFGPPEKTERKHAGNTYGREAVVTTTTTTTVVQREFAQRQSEPRLRERERERRREGSDFPFARCPRLEKPSKENAAAQSAAANSDRETDALSSLFERARASPTPTEELYEKQFKELRSKLKGDGEEVSLLLQKYNFNIKRVPPMERQALESIGASIGRLDIESAAASTENKVVISITNLCLLNTVFPKLRYLVITNIHLDQYAMDHAITGFGSLRELHFNNCGAYLNEATRLEEALTSKHPKVFIDGKSGLDDAQSSSMVLCREKWVAQSTTQRENCRD